MDASPREDVLAYKEAPTAVAASAQVASEQVRLKQASSSACKAKVTGSVDRIEERVPLKGIRKVIANAMVKSVYTAPHVTIMDEVDVSKLVELRKRLKPIAEERGSKLTYLAFYR